MWQCIKYDRSKEVCTLCSQYIYIYFLMQMIVNSHLLYLYQTTSWLMIWLLNYFVIERTLEWSFIVLTSVALKIISLIAVILSHARKDGLVPVSFLIAIFHWINLLWSFIVCPNLKKYVSKQRIWKTTCNF